MPKLLFCIMRLKFTLLKWLQHLSGARDLHCGWNKMPSISQTTFWNAFSWMNMYEFSLSFHWSLFLVFQLAIFQHWLRWWLCHLVSAKPLSQPMMVTLLMQICITRPQWVKWPMNGLSRSVSIKKSIITYFWYMCWTVICKIIWVIYGQTFIH